VGDRRNLWGIGAFLARVLEHQGGLEFVVGPLRPRGSTVRRRGSATGAGR
jgi:hypothetical protein